VTPPAAIAPAQAHEAWVIAEPEVDVGDLLAGLDVLGFAARRSRTAAISALPGRPSLALVVGAGDDAGADARRACLALRGDPLLAHVPIVVVVSAGRIPVADPALNAHELLVRPLRPGELLSRIDRASAAATPRTARDGELGAGALRLDPCSRSAWIDGRRVSFSAREFGLLAYLVRHPVRVHSRAHLLRVVWHGEAGVGTRAVDVQVRRVRAKLGDELRGCIRTVRRVGYAFTLPV
jgi:DNA-binding response OmpR family regulator